MMINQQHSSILLSSFLRRQQQQNRIKCWSSLYQISITLINHDTTLLSISNRYYAATSLSENKEESSFTSSSFATVIVKRNHQSMEFRRGNPLIYANSIVSTFGGLSSSSLAMGTLVQVYVEPTKSESSTPLPTKVTKKSNRKSLESSSSSSSYPHHPNQRTMTLGTFLGYGIYNPNSLYRVRILCHATLHPHLTKSLSNMMSNQMSTASLSSQLVMKILHHHISSAWNLRQTILFHPKKTTTTTPTTTAYRWINGEGDGLSGLAVDILDSWIVVMSSASWCEIFRTEIETVLQDVQSQSLTMDQHRNDGIIWKQSLRRLHQDGCKSTKMTTTETTTTTITNTVDDTTTTMNQSVIIRENDIIFRTYPFQDGQKTGFYCDQRDNRLSLAQQYCHNKRVLDLYCFQGGFSLAAKVLGGALHCTGVDSSQAAIDACWENAKLNHLTDMTFLRDDVEQFLSKAKDSIPSQSWDVILLDPPKLAPTVSGLERASRKYHSLNRDAICLINPKHGGILVSCTCSAAMSQKDGGTYFVQMIQQAAIAAGRHVTLLRTTGASICHTQNPACHPAGSYLTVAWFHVSPNVCIHGQME